MELELLQHNLDTIWIICASAMVLFMQAGFSCLETGLVRAKNSINVAIKNVSDLVFSMAGYWLLGFGLMFGTSYLGLVGITGFTMLGHDTPEAYTFFLFQAVFAGTAVTIVSGAMAERVKFNAYLTAALIIGSFIYPIFGHWAWGGSFLDGEDGWLKALGFHDFAGSTVVHSIGGWVGLAGALALGPRLGRFDEKGRAVTIPGHNLALAALGIFILWFGWFGFNGGSTLRGDTSVALILVNTNISAAMGGIAAFFLSLIIAKRPLVEKLLNGILGGLVAITAGCDLFTPGAAALVGLGGGCVAYLAEDLLIKLRVDDPVGAVAAHGFCGVWGTMILAVLAPAAALPTGSHIVQLVVQFTGAATAFIWAFGSGSLMFWLLKELGALRVSPEDEITGLNISEHGARMSWVDTVTTIKHILDTGDLSQRIDEETGTEMGEVAQSLNAFLDDVEVAASVARKVAEGDLSTEVRPKSELDILGQASVRMVEGLRQAKLSRREVMVAISEIVKTGDLSRRVEVTPGSEMEAVAESFNILLESILDVASVARSVSEGDLSLDVTPKSDNDILAQATLRMVQSLRAAKLSRESVIASIKGIVDTGDLRSRVTNVDDPDMAVVADSFNTLLAEILDAAEIARKVAHGDLSQQVALKSDKDILGMAVNAMVENLHRLLGKVDGVARALSDSVLRLDNSSQELETSNTDIVQSISRAADLVDRSIHAVQAMNLQAQAGAEAKEETQSGITEVGGSLSHLAETIKSFAGTAESISRITETIQAIADQTNLLALNATIQAVGAGEAGRGFAVVAHEIKELARESTKASEEVVRLVEGVRKDTGHAVKEALRSEESTLKLSMDLSRGLSETFDGIRGAVEEVTDKMESVVRAADEQNLVVGKNARAVESISAISRILRDQADSLSETMSEFVLDKK